MRTTISSFEILERTDSSQVDLLWYIVGVTYQFYCCFAVFSRAKSAPV